MPISAAELAKLGKYSLEDYLKNNPIDQITKDKPFMDLMMGRKATVGGGKQYIVEQLRVKRDNNFQWFYGNDTVSYNSRDPIEQSEFKRGAVHDGFTLHEDDFINNGIIVTDDNKEPMTQNEKVQLTDLFKEHMISLSEGMKEELDFQMHLDGTQDPDAVPGLDHLVSLNGVGTVGNIDATANPWWQNQFAAAIAPAALVETMEKQLRACRKHGGRPDKLIVGEDFYDAYRVAAKGELISHYETGGKVRSMDTGVEALSFHGIPLMIDYTFEDLDARLAPAVPWQKRCYMLDSKSFKYRPIRGHDMKTRDPKRDKDSYVHYWAVTHRFSLTCNKRRANSAMSIA